MNKIELLRHLHDINVIKRGYFTLKNGAPSSVYIDLRSLISYPKFLRAMSELVWEKSQALSYDLVCGVPYTALPVATCLAVDHNIPMLLTRKEAKAYGTKKQIEGIYSQGQKCLIVEDVVTTGSSVLEVASILEQEELKVTDVIVLVEREQAAREHLRARGYELHAIFMLSDLL